METFVSTLPFSPTAHSSPVYLLTLSSDAYRRWLTTAKLLPFPFSDELLSPRNRQSFESSDVAIRWWSRVAATSRHVSSRTTGNVRTRRGKKLIARFLQGFLRPDKPFALAPCLTFHLVARNSLREFPACGWQPRTGVTAESFTSVFRTSLAITRFDVALRPYFASRLISH